MLLTGRRPLLVGAQTGETGINVVVPKWGYEGSTGLAFGHLTTLQALFGA